MHEILPRAPTGPPELISPALFGELSRRLPSELVVQNWRPLRTGLVGNSSGPPLRSCPAPGALRKNSKRPRGGQFVQTPVLVDHQHAAAGTGPRRPRTHEPPAGEPSVIGWVGIPAASPVEALELAAACSCNATRQRH